MRNEIPSEVLEVLKRSVVVGKELFLPKNEKGKAQQLPRDLYVATDKVLNLLGGKWERATGSHVFAVDAGDRVADAVLSGHVIDEKKLYQFFETPAAICDQLVDLADIRSSDRVLEPSAGNGAIIDAIIRAHGNGYCEIIFCELHKERATALSDSSDALLWNGLDFLTLDNEPFYDRVIANPPFRAGQDVDHVTKMIGVTQPGGRVVSVMSPGFEYRNDKRHTQFRELLGKHQHQIIDIPEKAFAEYGTQIRTKIVVVNK